MPVRRKLKIWYRRFFAYKEKDLLKKKYLELLAKRLDKKIIIG